MNKKADEAHFAMGFRDFPLGPVVIDDQAVQLYLAIRTLDGNYRRRDPLIPLNNPQGERIEVEGYFYYWPQAPHAVDYQRDYREERGEVMVATADALYYVEDNIIVLEDCSRSMFGYVYNLEQAPEREAEYRALWLAFERVLGEVLPEPTYLVTSSEVSSAEPDDWYQLLLSLGYRKFNEHAMQKKP